MNKEINVKEIKEKNPSIDLKIFEEAVRLLVELQKAGINPKKYDLNSPFSKRVNRVDDAREITVLRKVG